MQNKQSRHYSLMNNYKFVSTHLLYIRLISLYMYNEKTTAKIDENKTNNRTFVEKKTD